ncbi:MAG: phosphatidate cytidylyltransferase [Myxococcota bacterium]
MSDGTQQGADAVPAAPEPVHPQPPTPTAPTQASERSNLVLRLGTASVVIPAVIYLIVQGGLWLLGAVIGIILLGLREFYQLIDEKGAHPLVGYGMAGGAALPVVAYLGNEYHATILMTAVLLGVMVLQLGKRQISEALVSISGTFFGVFYVGWLFAHVVVLRGFHDVVAARWGPVAAAEWSPDVGIFFLLFAATVVVASDAGAYFAGRAYGRRKLAPAISPGKTVEGALGGIVAGVFAGGITKLVFLIFWPDLPRGFDWTSVVLFGVVVSIAGILGDLVESLLKRDAQTKDTGTLLPGMGGVLDRIDSALLGIPVMYYLLLAQTFLRTV